MKLSALIDQLQAHEAESHGDDEVVFVGLAHHFTISPDSDAWAGEVYIYGKARVIAQNVEVS